MGENRSEVVQLRLTPSELWVLRARAEFTGQGMSSLLRQSFARCEKVDPPIADRIDVAPEARGVRF